MAPGLVLLPFDRLPHAKKARSQNRPIQAGFLFDVFTRILERAFGTLRHIACLQILHVHAAILLRERVRGFHLKVTANMTNSSVQLLQFFQQSPAFAARLRFIEGFCSSGLGKLLARCSVQRQFALIANNLFFELLDSARIEIKKLTVAGSHRMNHAQINADIKFLWIRHLNVKFRREDHEPMTAILPDVNLPDRARLHGTIGAFER